MKPANIQPFFDGLELYITPQNTCNLRCDFCCNRHILNDPNRLSDEVLYLKLQPLYEKANMIWVVGGEITALAGMKEYIRFFGENHPQVNLAIITNGTNFDEEWQRLCVEFDVFVRWSINAGDEISYERSARYPNAKETYRKIIGNLLSFNRMKADARRPYPRPGITNVLTHQSANDMPSFIRFACEHRFAACIYSGLEGEWIGDTDGVLDDDWHLEANRRVLEMKQLFECCTPIQIEHMPNRFYEQAKREAKLRIETDREAVLADYAQIQIVCNSSTEQMKKEYAAYRQKKNKRPFPVEIIEIDGTAVCPRPWNYIALSPNGSVTPCCRRILTLGNINEQPIEEILNSEKAVRLRERMLAGKFDHCWGSCERNLNPDSSSAYRYRERVISQRDNWFDGSSETRQQLEPHFFELKLNALRADGITHLAVYGAGVHTRRLLLSDAARQFETLKIVDDNPATHGQEICGFPVGSMRDALDASCDTLLISSDAHEAKMFQKAKETLPKTVRIKCLYQTRTA